MLRRIPPALLALGATVVLLAVVIGVFIAIGGGNDRPVGTCTPALEAGPYGCTVFVSVSGTLDGQDAQESSGGAITFRIEQDPDGTRLVYSGDCNGGEGPVAVTAARYRFGSMTSGQKSCEGVSGAVDAWASALFRGTVQVIDNDDATVELVRGNRRALFAQAIAAKP